MRVLVIGGTGLISAGIVPGLVARGDDVTLFNRGRTAAEPPPGTRAIAGDRRHYDAFERQVAEAGPFDCVIEMICYSPDDAHSLVRACRGRVGQVLFCSTVDVYARPAARYPITEDEPRGPAPWQYAQDKAVCEGILEEAHDRGDFALTVIRPAHTYNDTGTILHTFGWRTYYLDRLRRGKPILVHGDGSSLWASCHRDDVARAFVAAAGSESTFGHAYHTAGEEPMTWDQYHRTVARALGAPEPELVHIPTDLLARLTPRAFIAAVNFRYDNIFDNSAARRDLGFEYTVPWLEGAARIFAWLDAHGGIEDSDSDDHDDRILDAWRRLGAAMADELAGLEE